MATINLISDTIDRDDISALCDWLKQEPTPKLTKGELTVALEERWAGIVGTKYSLFVNSGSSAILLLLAAYKELRGFSPTIVVPALSWVTDVSSPMLLGYDVILCDCNLDDLSCDLDGLREIFERENPDIFLSVSPLGLVPDIDAILKLCKEFNVLFIEDNCESMGSVYKGKQLGLFGYASVFSMFHGHHLSTIEGGLINTNDVELYKVMTAMRSHGWDRDWDMKTRLWERKIWDIDEFDAKYTFYYPGMNLRSTDLQAFMGLRALDKLYHFRSIRNSNFLYYLNRIETNVLKLSQRSDDIVSSFAYPIVNTHRRTIVQELMESGVEVRPLISGSIGRQPFWINLNGIKRLPNADLCHDFGFYVPNHQGLTRDNMDTIIKILNKY